MKKREEIEKNIEDNLLKMISWYNIYIYIYIYIYENLIFLTKFADIMWSIKLTWPGEKIFCSGYYCVCSL